MEMRLKEIGNIERILTCHQDRFQLKMIFSPFCIAKVVPFYLAMTNLLIAIKKVDSLET